MTSTAPNSHRRAHWLKTLHEWHWISSAVCLVGMVLFAITGFTLNHAGSIEAKPQVTHHAAKIDARLREQILLAAPAAKANKGKAELPEALQAWVNAEWSVPT